jgi:hypothetical protein
LADQEWQFRRRSHSGQDIGPILGDLGEKGAQLGIGPAEPIEKLVEGLAIGRPDWVAERGHLVP